MNPTKTTGETTQSIKKQIKTITAWLLAKLAEINNDLYGIDSGIKGILESGLTSAINLVNDKSIPIEQKFEAVTNAQNLAISMLPEQTTNLKNRKRTPSDIREFHLLLLTVLMMRKVTRLKQH